MTYEGKNITDLELFAAENDDGEWHGSEPTRPGRPSSMRPPPMPLASRERKLSKGVAYAAAFTWVVLAGVGYWVFG
jgi:hypothetical protein